MANKKSRPAKDIKPTDLRAKALQEAKTNKTKALASEMKKKASAQAASKKVGPAKDLNKGGARAKFLKDVKSGKIKVKPPKVINKGLPTAAASRLMKLGSTATLAATFFLGDTFSTKTGGAAQAPAPKKYEKPSPYAVTGKGRLRPEVKKAETKKNIVGNNPNRGLSTSKASSSGMTGNGRLRPEVKKSTQAAKNIVGNNPNRNIADTKPKTQMDNWKDKKKALDKNPSQGQGAAITSAAPAVKKAKGMTFQQAVRRNVTDEYTRAKMKPKGSLLGLLRKRKG